VTSRGELLERESELERVSSVLSSGTQGGELVWIEGEAGIGKTRLLDAARERASRRGMKVLAASGGRLEHDFPFGVVRQLFCPLLLSFARAEQAEILSGPAALARPLLTGGEQHELKVGALGNPMYQALYWLCANVAQTEPLLITVDDLHWADAESVGWLAFLARRLDDLPVSVILAARDDEPAAGRSALLELSSQAATTVEPAPLSMAATRTLLEQALGDPAQEFCAACHDATAGNPFYLRELIAELRRRRIDPSAEQTPAVHGLGPEAVSRALLLRLGSLPAEAAALARAVSVLGEGARVHHAAALAGISGDEAAQAGDALSATGLLTGHPRLLFSHPIVAAAVYSDMQETARSFQHRRAAEVLAVDGAPVEEVATHLLATAPQGDPWVVERLREAATKATASGAPGAAVRYLVRALEEPPEHGLRTELLLELATPAIRSGRIDVMERFEEAHRDADDPGLRAELALPLAQGLVINGRVPEAVEMLEAAAADVAEIDRELSLRVEAMLTSMARLDPASAARTGNRLLRFTDLAGETPAERLVLANVARQLLLVPGKPVEEAVEVARRALGDGQLLREDGPESPPLYYAIRTLITADRYAEAERAADAAIADARHQASTFGFVLAGATRGLVYWRTGRLAEAEADLRACVSALEDAGSPLAIPTAVGHLLDVLAETGRFDEAEQLLEKTGMDAEIPDAWLFQAILAARGRLRTAQGRLAEGLEDQLERGRRDARLGHPDAAGYTHRTDAAPALAALGRPEEASEMIDEEVRLARMLGTGYALGMSLRARGLVRGGTDGLDDLREAATLLDAAGARLEHARALVDLGAALRRANQRAEARSFLSRGMDLASSCGATRLADRARDELRATGARPRRQVLTGVDSLTASELRTARMAADGMSNREIAQALFVTTKTVETHLRHVYQKLDINSRKELPDSLRG
jgi:DNA-binding CsgD family transcriptional regulator